MTQVQSELFSQILDVNWNLKEYCDNGEWMLALKTQDALDELIRQLKESMGIDAFHSFMNNGKKMFASK